MAFAPVPGLSVGNAADLGDRQLWTPPPAPGGPSVVAVAQAPIVVPLPPSIPAPVLIPSAASVSLPPRRSHLVAKPPVTIDYAAELVALKAELFLLTARVQQLEARPLQPLPSRTWPDSLHAWWQLLQRCWRWRRRE
jgi:hypothetical protein